MNVNNLFKIALGCFSTISKIRSCLSLELICFLSFFAMISHYITFFLIFKVVFEKYMRIL